MSVGIMHNVSKRGDTIIEVMIAFTIFSLVIVLSVLTMNSGLAAGERSLEAVTARNELNAQAEALRFIYSSYVSELTLPECGLGLPADTPCQKYNKLWQKIKNNAVSPSDYDIPYPLSTCDEVYNPSAGSSSNLLQKNNAFVINPRKLVASATVTDANQLTSAYFSINDSTNRNGTTVSNSSIFKTPPLNARMLYAKPSFSDDTSEYLSSSGLNQYTEISAVEGIWVVAVKGDNTLEPPYYDFYIETCWYGSDTSAPSSLDTIIRLYNSEGN